MYRVLIKHKGQIWNVAAYICVCAGFTAMEEYLVGKVEYSLWVWLIYGGVIAVSLAGEFVLAPRVEEINLSIILPWMIFFIVCISLTFLDLYYTASNFPELRQPGGLTWSYPLWFIYGSIMVMATIFHIRTQRTCPYCGHMTKKRFIKCHRCRRELRT